MPFIRLAADEDAEAIQAIYAPIVRETATSFETEVPPADEMRERIRDKRAHFPWLVCEMDGRIAGYVYAARHRERLAYQWSVDVSAYVAPQFHRFGIGSALYTSLFQILRLQHFANAYAGIALPNPASVGLHTSLGFEPVGVYRSVGYKLGAWRDVGWWHLLLLPLLENPAPPLPMDTVRGLPGWNAALASGLPRIRPGH